MKTFTLYLLKMHYYYIFLFRLENTGRTTILLYNNSQITKCQTMLMSITFYILYHQSRTPGAALSVSSLFVGTVRGIPCCTRPVWIIRASLDRTPEFTQPPSADSDLTAVPDASKTCLPTGSQEWDLVFDNNCKHIKSSIHPHISSLWALWARVHVLKTFFGGV